MQKKTRLRSRLPDLLVTLLCLMVAALFVLLFWKDLNAVTTRDDKRKIGTVSFRQRVAQRKFDDRMVWERLVQNADLYYADTIRTSDFSEVVIRFNNDATLNVSENSMVQVYYTEADGLMINVGGGDILLDSTDASDAVSITLGDGSVVSVDAGTSLSARVDGETGIESVQVQSGSAQLRTESGQETLLGFGESVSITAQSEVLHNPVTVTSLPRDLKLLSVEETMAPLRLEWRAAPAEDGTALPVTVQTSRSKDFSEIDSSVVVRDENSTELSATDGVLYWRVFTEESKDAPVEGKVTVQDVGRVQAVAPAEASTFRYRESPPRITFRWQGSDYAGHYRLSVSSSPDMRGTVAQLETGDSFAHVETLGQGTYWWQVTPYYSQNKLGYAGESEVHSFSVVQDERIRAPELSAPSEGAAVSYRGGAGAGPQTVHFLWKSELQDAAYTFMLARDAGFTDGVQSAEVAASRTAHDFATDGSADGTYYWKVIRRSSDPDDVTPESAVRSFTLVRAAPETGRLLYPADGYAVDQAGLPAVRFLWRLPDGSPADAASVVQFSGDAGFGSVARELAVSGSGTDGVTLPDGTYWWRVGQLSERSTPESFTAARQLVVEPTLEPPEFLAPEQNGALTVYAGSPVTISWKPVAGADYYAVRVLDSDGQAVAQLPAVRAESAQVVLAQGSYECRIQAGREGSGAAVPRLSGTASRAFSVRAPERIALLLPAEDAAVAGLTALREGLSFAWQPGADTAQTYEFVLSRVAANGSVRVVETQETSGTTASLPRLTEGSYRWRVRASTADGIPIDSEERAFSVRAVPDLSAPVLLEPAAQFVMDAAYLRAHRSITFRWRAVSGASAYAFTLYKRGADGSLKAVLSRQNLKDTQVVLRDLSLLDVGSFTWAVTASSAEQNGKTARASFSIDFDAPAQVETVQPGRLYAE